MKKIIFVLIGTTMLLHVSCQASLPEQNKDSWDRASPGSMGLDADKMSTLSQDVHDGRFRGVQSLVIIRNGKLILESYFQGEGRSELQKLFSVSKSITSLLIGIAIDNGLIQHTKTNLISAIPVQHHPEAIDSAKKNLTLEHALTMTCGFLWDEESIPFSDKQNSHTQMNHQRDWHNFVLSGPLNYEPGDEWNYNTGCSHLLGAVIKNSTGKHAAEFADQHLFRPLGIDEYKWNTDPMGYPCVGGSNGGLSLKTSDLAKIGQLVLNKGRWKGNQIVSEKWVEESTAVHVQATSISHYGYLWWRDQYRIKGKMVQAICAYGYGGQSLNIYPELNMVVAITSWASSTRAHTLPIKLKILNAAIKKKEG